MPAADATLHTITRDSRVIGFVCIHSTVQGRARGGLRIVNDLSKEELLYSSRAMTLKYGLLRLPQGGAKAGVFGDGDAPTSEKRRLLHEFARAAETLLRDRAYIPDADLGTSAADIRWMMESVGARVGPRDWRENRSGDHTARSCLASALALANHSGGSLEGSRVAIEGFGKVGSALARLLHERGATVVAVSTSRGALHRPGGLDVDQLLQRAAEDGSGFVEGRPETIERESLLELPVDLLFPCARFQSIHAGNAERVMAKAVCAGANGPVSLEAERVLADRGVPYPPDFVSNCGGVLGGTLEFAGVPFESAGALIEEHLRRSVSALLARAGDLGATPRAVAEPDALERHARVRGSSEQPGFGRRLQALGLEAYRRRLIPRRLVSPLASQYVSRRLA